MKVTGEENRAALAWYTSGISTSRGREQSCEMWDGNGKRNEKADVVIGSSLGTKLYLKLGFKLVGDISIQLDGEDDKMDLSVLTSEQDGGVKGQ
jgi:hypothetical protein